ncbi:MAG: hypothetical protein QOI06_2314 [Nocardioidaceae bacterium]|jgi:hypothetical protein|nr:hypothetical protein [Nocardioidaceae bacterium]
MPCGDIIVVKPRPATVNGDLPAFGNHVTAVEKATLSGSPHPTGPF